MERAAWQPFVFVLIAGIDVCLLPLIAPRRARPVAWVTNPCRQTRWKGRIFALIHHDRRWLSPVINVEINLRHLDRRHAIGHDHFAGPWHQARWRSPPKTGAS